MVSPLFSNEEVQLLHAMRSQSTDCKENFKQRFINSDLLCSLCKLENEDQQHLLRCRALINKLKSENLSRDKAKYDNIFSEIFYMQKEITSIYLELFRIRPLVSQSVVGGSACCCVVGVLRLSSRSDAPSWELKGRNGSKVWAWVRAWVEMLVGMNCLH